MLRFLKTILFLITVSPLFAQKDKLEVTKIADEYNWRTTTTDQFDSMYFGLPNPRFTSYKVFIRIVLSSQTIDLFSSDAKIFDGILTTECIQFNSVKNTQSGKNESKGTEYFYQKVKLDSNVCSRVAQRLFASGEDTIPTDTMIKTWQNGFCDCANGALYEFNMNKKYISKRYSCIVGQDSTVKYIDVIRSNYNFIDKEFDLQAKLDTFELYLPKGYSYSTNGIAVMYKLTDKEIKNWQRMRPYREYMQSIQDTLNGYLSDTLTKIFHSNKDSISYWQFFLRFSKRNKLEKIYTNEKFDNIPDVIEYYRDKKKIRKAFRHIHPDFVKSKMPYGKELDFIDNRAYIKQ